MEPTIAQQVIKGLTNIFFAIFVLAVLILTVIAVTYQPPDPWTQTGKALTEVLSSVRNATFKVDDSVVQTGEDFAPINSSTVVAEDQIAITESNFESDLVVKCDYSPQETTNINCSHPGVLAAIVSYNLQHLRNLDFFAYLTPVRGGEEDQCDVTWRFRAKREKSWRMYRDFRRFSLQFNQASCNYSVIRAEGWHSGKNARPSLKQRGHIFGGKSPHPKIVSAANKNTTVLEELEVIDDSVPTIAEEERTFTHGKYLYYSRGGDHCKKMNHYLWSFLCALGEARYLNRTLVMDLSLCLSGSNNPGHGDEDGKDFRLYFDFAHLKDSASVMEEKQFFKEWNLWNAQHSRDKVSIKEISDFKVTPMQLRQDRSIVLQRTFKLPDPDNYWFRVCEGETEKVIQRPWHLLWKSKRIMDIVNAICGQMEWDFDAVHVVRGEKAKNKELWPSLAMDTSVDSLIEKLSDQIDTSRNVYIATNEIEPEYFRRLKEVYSHAYSLDDFSALWEKGSMWYNQTMELTEGSPVEFDGYMRVEVDTEVSYRAKKKLETFGFLTNDCKDGINTC